MKIQDMRSVMIARLEYNRAQWRAKISPGLDYSSDHMWVFLEIRDARRAPFTAFGVSRFEVSHRGVDAALTRLQDAIERGLLDEALVEFYQPL